ncbi:serine hydrolase domain-containing protein [Roseateles oligotrophus]|uniref:Beta-lactamase family protein n=1 Tax=Roseateles oligotrophus TaxID=1769250 RepID=A0ABT2YC76_9BURK|nr:serine hydrolase domain-containing protein [Roseateles oligotrophus]MCV2367640.1 beta-lactamase family protein [Roseateles oligotrophus]
MRNTNSAEAIHRRAALGWLGGLALSPAWATEASEKAPLSERFEALAALGPELLRELQVPGAALVLLREGKPLYSAQFGLAEAGMPKAIQADTVFEAASMSKPLFAYLALHTVQAGQLDLDRPVLHYLPQEVFKPKQEWQRLITARMLLTHQSGLPNWRSAEDEVTNSLRIAFEPGQRFNYSGEGYFYLQRVLEAIWGEPLQTRAEKQLFKPLGMRHSGFVLTPQLDGLRARGHDVQGRILPAQEYRQANAAYTLYTTAADYALFLAEMLKRDRSAAHSLNPASLQAMLAHATPATDRAPIARPGLAQGLAVFWGLGWGINTTAQGDIAYHTGTNSSGFRNYCQFSPSRESGFVLMSNGLNGNQLWMRLMALQVITDNQVGAI